MKILVSLCVISLAIGHQQEQDEFNSWAKIKAMESCWGKENMKIYTIQMKKAVAKCSHQDAPELNLPQFRSPYKTVNVLLSSAEKHEQDNFQMIFQMMRLINNYNEMKHNNMNNEYNSYRPYSNDYNRHDNKMVDDEWMAHMLMKIMNKNMKKDMPYSHHSAYSNMPSMPNHMDRLNSLEKMMKNYFQQKNQYEEHNNFKSNYYNQDKHSMYDTKDTYRYKRQALRHSLSHLDLGDRFEAKLQAEKDRVTDRIGNMTCILQELNVLDRENQIDLRAMKRDNEKYTFPSAWFNKRYEELLDSCYQMATNLPANIEDQYEVEGKYGKVNVAQIKTFMNCCAKAKGQLCMNQDLKQQIESEFGDIDQILQKTGLTQHQLFSVVRSMLESQHDEFDFL